MGLAGGRPLSRGVAVRAGRVIEIEEVGAGLAFVGKEVVLCSLSGVWTASRVKLHAELGKMATRRKATNRM
jgi:hypothetical protein